MGVTDTVAVEMLGPDAVPDVLGLVTEAGWNQAAADIALILRHGRVIGVRDDTARLVASAAALPMGPTLGWVNMVLVTAAWRRRGIATRLVEDCVAWLAAGDRAAGLDATPMGRPVYERMGFAPLATLTRWVRPAVAAAQATKPAAPHDWPGLAEYDANIFGGARRFVLDDLMSRPGGLYLAVSGGNGFLMGRAGRLATQIGPVSAEDETIAGDLLEAGLAATSDRIVIDACDGQAGFARHLASAGFTAERSFHRMIRGDMGRLGDPRRAFAVAGPEFG